MFIKNLNDKFLNNSSIKRISDRFPFFKKFRRSFIARKDAVLPRKRTYSQSGEDIIVYEAIMRNDVIPTDYIYIDIGANQPTQISNTYLFYRLGYRGIVVEPNHELSDLFSRIRRGDTYLSVGCSERNGIGRFVISESSVISGFHENSNHKPKKTIWVPLLTVDEIWETVGERKKIFLMSVDTEGYDLKVLRGAKEALRNTMCLIVEVSDHDKEELYDFLLSRDFNLINSTENNLIWLNEKII